MIKDYFDSLAGLFDRVAASDRRGKDLIPDDAVNRAVGALKKLAQSRRKAMLIGNGGSASIVSHIAADLLKNCSLPAVVFNDAALLTCLTNDLGYDRVFQTPIDVLARPDDVLIAVSSSGRSRNIIGGALRAQEAGCYIITFSGFDQDNPLRGLGDINFYAPSHSYGEVEITHLAVCHHIVDILAGFLS